MLADAELGQDFTILNQRFKELTASLLGVVGMPGIPGGDCRRTRAAFAAGSGSSVCGAWNNIRACGTRQACMHAGGRRYPAARRGRSAEDGSAVLYRCDLGIASLHAFPARKFIINGRPLRHPAVKSSAGNLCGAGLRSLLPTPRKRRRPRGFENYQPGDIIIRQRRPRRLRVQYVQWRGRGAVDRVTVGRIGGLDAMAARTCGPQRATVRAEPPPVRWSRCPRSSSRTHPEQPATIHSLLIDAAEFHRQPQQATWWVCGAITA